MRKLKQNRSLPDVIFSLSSQIDLNLGQVSINTTSASQVEICTCIGTGQCFLFPQTFDFLESLGMYMLYFYDIPGTQD